MKIDDFARDFHVSNMTIYRDINVIITDSRAGQNPEKRAILQKCADEGVSLVYAAG